MTQFERVVSATQHDFQRKLLDHPLAQALQAGTVKLGHYFAYLRETYHLVRHTPRIFQLAASRIPDSRQPLRDWFLELADEETGHDALCVKDISRLGGRPDTILSGRAGAGGWGVVTQDYYLAGVGKPIGLLGSTSLSEQLGATVAEPAIKALLAALNMPAAALGFIRSHGVFDAKHLEDVARAINTFAEADEIDEIIYARKMAITHCSQMLTDILENPVP